MTTITTKTRARIGKDPVPPRPMTVEEYARFEEPEDGYRYELVRGILTVQEPGPGYPHGFLQADLVRHLGNWARQCGGGNGLHHPHASGDGPPPGHFRFYKTGGLGKHAGELAARSARNSDRSTLPIEHAESNA